MRPVTLFTIQWGDLPLEEMCRQAQEMGYSCFQVNSGLSLIDNGGASFGFSFKYGNVIRGKVSLGGQIGHRHRSRFNPVF